MFNHLRVHSAYSLLEGAIHLKSVVRLAAADAQPAVAVTDTGNLFGALEFSEAAFAAGVQPLVGCTLPVRLAERIQNGRRIAPVARLPLIATTAEGFANLQRIVSRAYLASNGEDVAVPLGLLGQGTAEIVALTGWLDGPVGMTQRLADADAAADVFATLREAFGDRLYSEVQRHGLAEEVACEALAVDLAYDAGVPLVATNEVYFAGRDDFEAHDALIAIAAGRRLGDDDRRRLTPEHWFKPQATMEALFADLPEAIDSTAEIALRTSFRPRKRAPMLPRFLAAERRAAALSGFQPGAPREVTPLDAPDPAHGTGTLAATSDREPLAMSGRDPAAVDASPDATPIVSDEAELAAEAGRLAQTAREGLVARLASRGLAPGIDRETYDKRLAYELDVIASMGFPGYFLIVADFIQWAKRNGVPVGPGRGSGAGSLVAYALTITDLDPLQFDLLFERFLNPERVSMPDFDIDFCQEKRERVIDYVQKRYGEDRVAQIITFGTLQARAVVRDVGRVLDMPYGKVDQLAKLIPQNPANPVTLPQALEIEPRLKQAREADPEVERLIQIALKLEGLYRHASTHAAGIVIGDRALEDIVPLYRDPRSSLPVSQYNMKWVESAGLVKFDFLGLKTLTVIERALAMIAQPIDLDTLPLDDPGTYALLARGETAGVFQLESAGMRKALVGMKPDRFADIIAIVSLYRPGPMDNIPSYNRRKNGQETPDYLHPKLEPILKETYGIIIYQEQVMQIAQELSGYSLGEADLLRRAMGKKIAAEMAVQLDRFVDGAVERGVKRADARHIFDLVQKFANYGFNKSHAAAYALVAYQTAWLKANFPHEFLAASMTLDMGNTDKLADFRAEAQRMGIRVRPPCIMTSKAEFSVDGGEIVYGLAAVKGVGRPLVEHVAAARTAQPYRSLSDFANRLDPKAAPKRALDALVAAGAFDCWVADRASLSAGLDQVLGVANRVASGSAVGQTDFFGAAAASDIRLPTDATWTPAERLQRELDAVGFYLSAHPLDDFREVLAKAQVPQWKSFAQAIRRGEGARLAGVVVSRQERRTRTGNRIGIIALSDPSGQYEAVVFSDMLEAYRDKLEPGACVLLSVTAEERDDGVSVRVQHVEPLARLAAAQSTVLTVFLDAPAVVTSIDRLIGDGGACQVRFIALVGGGREVEVALRSPRNVSRSVANAIKAMPGVVDVNFA